MSEDRVAAIARGEEAVALVARIAHGFAAHLQLPREWVEYRFTPEAGGEFVPITETSPHPAVMVEEGSFFGFVISAALTEDRKASLLFVGWRKAPGVFGVSFRDFALRKPRSAKYELRPDNSDDFVALFRAMQAYTQDMAE